MGDPVDGRFGQGAPPATGPKAALDNLPVEGVMPPLTGATEWIKVEDLDRMQEFDFDQHDPQADDAAAYERAFDSAAAALAGALKVPLFVLRDDPNPVKGLKDLCKAKGVRQVLAVGDAAGFVNPMNGEGIDFKNFYLPLGISFFTFQLIGYWIDVYNEETDPENDILSFFTRFLLFLK